MASTLIPPSASADGQAWLNMERTWYIRFYLWLYEANESDINTCKLFWAYIFVLPALLLRGVFEVGALAIDGINSVLPERKVKDTDTLLAEYDARRAAARTKAARGPSKMERTLNGVANFMSSAYVKVAPVLRWVLVVVGVLAGIALAIFLVYAAINWTGAFFTAIGIIVGIATLATIGALLAVYLEDRRKYREPKPKKDNSFFKTMKRLGHGFHNHTCAKINLQD